MSRRSAGSDAARNYPQVFPHGRAVSARRQKSKESKGRLIVLPLALAFLLFADGVEARRPRAPTLTQGEIYVFGEMVLYDPGSLATWGDRGLRERSQQSLLVRNGVALRSGLPNWWILSYLGLDPTGRPATDNAGTLADGCTHRAIVQLRKRIGAHIVMFWGDRVSQGRAYPLPAVNKPGHGCAAMPTGAEFLVGVHEAYHNFGLGHEEANWASGTGVVPIAMEYVAPDGTSGAMRYGLVQSLPIITGSGVTYDGRVFGDAAHDNAGVARVTSPLIATYSSVVNDPDRSCPNDVETACLHGRFRVRVAEASVSSALVGYATVNENLGNMVTFKVASVPVTVALTSAKGKWNLTIIGGAASNAYAVVISDTKPSKTASRTIRAWATGPNRALVPPTVVGAF